MKKVIDNLEMMHIDRVDLSDYIGVPFLKTAFKNCDEMYLKVLMSYILG